MTQDRLFEGARRLSVVITALWFIGCLVPVFFSAKEVWKEHQLRANEHEAFWEFAKEQPDKKGPWTLFRFEDTKDRAWRKLVEPTNDEWNELQLHHPTDSLEMDLEELRGRSWKNFIGKAEGPLELAIFGALLIFATRKAGGWVIRGFIGSEKK